MILERVPLAKQLDLVFKEISEELMHLSSGVVFVQIRQNTVGKFGVRHFPVESRSGVLEPKQTGLSKEHIRMFTEMAVASLKRKHHWTHGEIHFEFALIQNTLRASVQFESNYNMIRKAR
ncbi:hypothetical protein [Paenibacillus senegalensis]|uniref:hypothetical protein n=1 Tax=Paenibacillus senegalensis TaxID=1465766 RepID=UPI0002892930|nr:hypothetical protein [Paenibacillus senegalensis]